MDNPAGPSLDLTTKNFILVFVGTLSLVFVAVLAFALNDARHLDPAISEATLYVLQDYIYAALILTGVYIFGIKIAKLTWADIGFVPCSVDWVIRAMLAGVMVYSFRTFMDALGFNLFELRRMVEPGATDTAILREATDTTTVGLAVAIAIVTPLATEIFQRGILFAWLRRNFNFLLAAIASAIIFGGLHIQLTRYGQALVFGLIAAYFYEKSRSLWPALAYHVTVNCAYLLAIMT